MIFATFTSKKKMLRICETWIFVNIKKMSKIAKIIIAAKLVKKKLHLKKIMHENKLDCSI